MSYEPCAEGEIYMICQGAGGGYGDVLEREPFQVLKDVEDELLSVSLAQEIYKIIIDPQTLILDDSASILARQQEREERKRRGQPYKDFCEQWVKPAPSDDLPYMGSWGDTNDEITASPPGEKRYRMKADEMTGVMLSNPKDRRINELEKEMAQLRAIQEET